MKDVVGQHVPWPKNLVILNEKKVKLNPISVLLTLEQMFISQNYIKYLVLMQESDSRDGELLVTQLLHLASKKSTWTLKDLFKYVDTKMEMDRSTVITLSEEVFGKKRVVYVFQEDIQNFYRLKMINQTQIVIYMRLAIFWVDFISTATMLLFKHLNPKFNKFVCLVQLAA